MGQGFYPPVLFSLPTMPSDPLDFQAFVGTSADEQRWQIANAILTGGDGVVSYSDVAIDSLGNRVAMNVDSLGRLQVDALTASAADLTIIENQLNTLIGLTTVQQAEVSGIQSQLSTGVITVSGGGSTSNSISTIQGFDGTSYKNVKTDSLGNLNVNILSGGGSSSVTLSGVASGVTLPVSGTLGRTWNLASNTDSITAGVSSLPANLGTNSTLPVYSSITGGTVTLGSGTAAIGTVGVSSLPSVSLSGGTVTLGAGSASIGSVNNTGTQFSKISISTQSITRPANTTAYSANAVINTATSGATATQFTSVLPVSGGDGYIVAVRAATNVSSFSTALRLHLYKTTPSASVQDAAQFTMLNADFSARVGYVDLSGWTTGGTGSDTAVCFGSFPGAGITLPLELGTTVLYAILETRAAFTPKIGRASCRERV